jgi:hypothetical protein
MLQNERYTDYIFAQRLCRQTQILQIMTTNLFHINMRFFDSPPSGMKCRQKIFRIRYGIPSGAVSKGLSGRHCESEYPTNKQKKPTKRSDLCFK